MKALFRENGLVPLLAVQSQVAFNDNVTKLALVGLVQMVLSAGEAGAWVGAISLLLVAPFVLFAPLAGWLADRFPKRAVLEGSLWLQLAVMALLVIAVAAGNLVCAVGGFFLLGVQSALMSPARRGIIKELAPQRVAQAVGWMEMLCIAAILAGGVAGGLAVDAAARATGSPWSAAVWVLSGMTVLCVSALAIFRGVPSKATGTSGVRFGRDAVFGHARLIGLLRSDKSLWRAALGDASFYFAGGILALTLSQAGRILHPSGNGAAGSTGLFLALVGIGVATGSAISAQICRKRSVLALVPAGAAGIAIMALVAAGQQPGSPGFAISLVGLGLGGGAFLVPLGAILVGRARESRRGRILAASSMLSSLAGVAAVGAHWLLSTGFGLGVAGQMAAIGCIFTAVALAAIWLARQDVLRHTALSIAKLRYGVQPICAENLPSEGGVLLVCNHVSYVDTIILSLACPRPIRFLSYEGFFGAPVLGWLLKTFGAIPVSSTRAKEGIRAAAECLRAGEVVCIFPEGQLTRTGQLLEIKPGYELIAHKAGCPLVAAYLDGLWGSIHSFEGGRYFAKWPKGLRRNTRVVFSAPLADKSPASVRETLLGLSAAAHAARPCGTLGQALVGGLAHFHEVLVDPPIGNRSLRGFELLGLACVFASRFRDLEEERIGVVLPPGAAGAAANVGLVLAGKVPVNLNPTMAPDSARQCLERAGIRTIVSDPRAIKKFPSFPWTENLFDAGQLAKSANRAEIAARGLAAVAVPWSALSRASGDPESEAAVLFTSGSSGLPEGVPFSHRNLLANIHQVSEGGFFREGDRVLSPLPLFHCFGLTMGLFLPLIRRIPLVAALSPLDHDGISKAARRGHPTILLATPTFLRGYVRGVPRDSFGTLRLAVAGAERLPDDLGEAFRARFGIRVFQGYGLTEASPVACLGMEDPALGPCANSVQAGARTGSVGRLAPGIAARFLDPETGSHLPGAREGLLALKGPNIIRSYIGNSRPERFSDGWFITGDIAAADAEGFLEIRGRLSRFSKIGGEMVSHAAVEIAIAEFLGEGADCVVGRKSDRKGEELVLVTTRALGGPELRSALAGKVPGLWIPAAVVRAASLPALASGKTDVSACVRLAENGGLGALAPSLE